MNSDVAGKAVMKRERYSPCDIVWTHPSYELGANVYIGNLTCAKDKPMLHYLHTARKNNP